MKHISRLGQVIFTLIIVASSTLQGFEPADARDGDGVRIQRNAQTGKVSHIGAAPGRPISIRAAQAQGMRSQDRALTMVQQYAADFGLKQADRELKVKKSESERGRQITKFQQTYEGIPVVGGELIVNASETGGLLSIDGEIAPDLSLDTQPQVTAEQAQQTALGALAKSRKADIATLQASEPELWIYDARLLHPDGQPAALVWRMEVTSTEPGEAVDELVLVDAQRDSIRLMFNQVDTLVAEQSQSDEPPTETPVPPADVPTDVQTELPTEVATDEPAPTEPVALPEDVSPRSEGMQATITGTPRYVATTGTNAGTCTDSGAPCLTISYAIGQATAGDTILVATGTYTGIGSQVVYIDKAVTLSGGWDAAFTSQNGFSTLDGQNARRVIFTAYSTSSTIDRFVIQHGYSYTGGGVSVSTGASATITNSTIRDNAARGDGGSGGGGLIVSSASLTLSNVTLSGNTAQGYGGAIYSSSSTVTILNTTIAHNTGENGGGLYQAYSSIITLQNTILARNVAGSGPDCYGQIIAAGHNIIANTSRCTASPHTGDQFDVDPHLGVELIGGMGYYTLASSSPAIDAADPATCPAVDQRGMARPVGACDIGAYEYVAAPGPAVSFAIAAGSNQRAAISQPLRKPLTIYAMDAAGSAVSGLLVTFAGPSSGPGGTFPGGLYEISIETDSTGMAIAPVLTTNSEPGSFTVTATASGLPGSAAFGLTIGGMYVNSTRPDDSADCASPATACRTINAALNKATTGDTILVASGTYTGTGSYVVSIYKPLTLSGGWNGSFTEQDGISIIDGQDARVGFLIIGQLPYPGADIRHFQVEHAYAPAGVGAAGIMATGAYVTISDTSVLNSNGRGISIDGLIVSLEGVLVQGNRVERSTDSNGAGILLKGGWVEIDNSAILSNISTDNDGHGGGIYAEAASLTIRNSTVGFNASAYGGGVDNYLGTTTVLNSTIVSNQASVEGGGYRQLGAPTDFRNSILAHNTAPSSPDCNAINLIDHNLFSTVAGCTLGPTNGNIVTTDVRFAPVPPAGLLFRPLAPNSPAIDAGNPATCLSTDQLGLPRPFGTACDMGSYEYRGLGSAPAYVFPAQGGGQSFLVETAAPVHLSALVVDSGGAVVPATQVTFTAPDAGASGNFPNGLRSVMILTDANGIADAGVFTANGVDGWYSVTAAAEGLETTAVYSLRNTVVPLNNITTWNMNHVADPAHLPGSFLCDLSRNSCTGGVDPDADHAGAYAYGTYVFYRDQFGRNGVDNAATPIQLSVHYGTNWQNSTWYNGQAVFGDGWPVDDIVAHELTHGLTEHESNLFYYFQSGAISESLSDIFGELYDQANGQGNDGADKMWLIGEDLTGFPNGVRSMSDPASKSHPDKMTSSYYDWDTVEADSGGIHANSGINNKAAYLLVEGGDFNNKSIAPLGADKTLAIYYEVNRHVLTSGADYADLYAGLVRACLNLVGGADGITETDCDSVQDAVDATEMNLQPVPGNYNPDAPLCNAGYTPSTVFFDNLENGAGNWVASGARWQLDSLYFQYAHSGDHFFYADDSTTYPPAAVDASEIMKTAVRLPASAYLHFAHAFDFEHYADDPLWYDGGVLEYSTGGAWIDAGQLIDFNGYRNSIAADWGNPLHNRNAFVGTSNGYISTRVNLSSLAGKNVKFRWRMGLDPYFGRGGWFLDDVRIYTCSPIPAVNVTVGGSPLGSYTMQPHTSNRQSYAGVNNGPVVVSSNTSAPIVVSERVAYSPDSGTNWSSFSEIMGLPSNQLTTSYVMPWYNNAELNTQVRFGNVGSAGTNVTVTIGGVVQGVYPLSPSQSTRISYAGLNNGPVLISSSGGVPIIASQRVAYSPDGGTTWSNFAELMALPSSKLTTSYVMPWYNNAELNTQIRFGNVGTAATYVTVTIGGVVQGIYPVAPNQSMRISYPGLNSGPVVVSSSGGVKIIASQRVAYSPDGGTTWSSFTELMGLPSSSLTNSYYLPVYDNVTHNDQLRFGNVGTALTYVSVTVGGVLQGMYPVAPSQSVRVSYPGLNAGPVQVTSTGSVPIIVSHRVAYSPDGGTTWSHFAELMGLPGNQLSTSYVMPWYNNVDLNTQLRFAVP